MRNTNSVPTWFRASLFTACGRWEISVWPIPKLRPILVRSSKAPIMRAESPPRSNWGRNVCASSMKTWSAEGESFFRWKSRSANTVANSIRWCLRNIETSSTRDVPVSTTVFATSSPAPGSSGMSPCRPPSTGISSPGPRPPAPTRRPYHTPTGSITTIWARAPSISSASFEAP